MKVIPCEKNREFEAKIRDFAETLKTESHRLGTHGLDENDVYNSGLFRAAIERIRGQFAASMTEKRQFVDRVLSHMQDGGYIDNYESSGSRNRHDYTLRLRSGKIAVIELKGCLDGNNTTIFQRPAHADEFIIWSVCANRGADPERNVWSGIHVRLSATIIAEAKQIDGLVVWDWVCGTIGRPCPKLLSSDAGRLSRNIGCLHRASTSFRRRSRRREITPARVRNLCNLSNSSNRFISASAATPGR